MFLHYSRLRNSVNTYPPKAPMLFFAKLFLVIKSYYKSPVAEEKATWQIYSFYWETEIGQYLSDSKTCFPY